MSATLRLFTIVAEASLFFTVASWALVFVTFVMTPVISIHGGVATVVVVIVPDALATWWLFRRLLVGRPRKNARRAATAFAVSAPVTLAVAYVLGELVGGYAEIVFGNHSILPAIGTFIIVLMIFVSSAVVAWTLHPSGGIEPVGESGQDEHR